MTFTTNGSAVVFTTSGTATSFTVTPAVTGFETSPTVTPGAHASTHGAGGADPITTLGTVAITSASGTATALTIGTATISGGTATGFTLVTPTIGTATATGGTFTNATLVTPTIGTATMTGGTATTLTASGEIHTGQSIFAAGSAAGPSIAPTGDTNTGIYFPAADAFGIATGGVQRARIDSAGNVGIGTATSVSTDGFTGGVIVSSSTAYAPQFVVQNSAADVSSPYFILEKSRSGGIVSAGDDVGTILFRGHDGVAFRTAASIVAEVDTTPGSSDMPGRMGFYTTADGGISQTERMRIDNAGLITGTGTSLGAWTSYTPTLTSDGTNPTLGTGSTAQGYYCKIGKTVHWRARIQFGTSGVAAGTGYYFVSLPVTSATYGTFLASFGHLIFADASTGKRYLGIANYNTTSQVSLQFQTDAGGASVVQYNDPMTWDTSDDIYIQGTYEAA